MAHQQPRSTAPLDVLQSTLDGIFIEIGNSLRISDKVAPKALVANANARLRTAIPRAIETFHQALDDIEADIVRAKAVLLRDLEEARARRIALEHPPPEAVEDLIKREPTADMGLFQENVIAESDQPIPQTILEDAAAHVPLRALETQDPLQDIVTKDSNIPKEAQGPSPPSSNQVNVKDETVVSDQIPPSATIDAGITGLTDASVDSLLAISADSNNHDDLNLNFDDMDFAQFTSNIGENSQSNANDFLSTFGNEDFNMLDLHTANNTENSNSNTESKKDDLLDMAINTAGDDMMDMDYFKPAEESSFDELFGGDEENMTGGGSMDHSTYDTSF